MPETGAEMRQPMAQQGQLHRQSSVKFDPQHMTRDDMPGWGNMKDSDAERKLEHVREGGRLIAQHEMIPSNRNCTDPVCALAFCATFVALIIGAVVLGSQMVEFLNNQQTVLNLHFDDGVLWNSSGTSNITMMASLTADPAPYISPGVVAGASIIGPVVALLATMGFLWFANHNAKCVVYTSLLFSPILSFIFGVALIVAATQVDDAALGFLVTGAFFILFGTLGFTCVMCCYRHLIPFMVMILEVVTECFLQNLGMIFVAFAGAVFSILWVTLCMICLSGFVILDPLGNGKPECWKHADPTTCNADSDCLWYQESDYATAKSCQQLVNGAEYGYYFLVFLVLFWGSLTAYYTCHCTYAGVFGRWYHQIDEEKPLRSSIGAAMKSFGSQAFGGFIIAFVRAMEQVVRMARRQARGEGNIVVCLILCVIECFISCIGDIMEYFNEWAYIQVALRGVNFCTAVKITFSMLTAGNLQYILSDLLLNSVVNLGAFMTSLIAAVISFLYGLGAAGGIKTGLDDAVVCLAIGWICGLVVGGVSMAILSAGVKTILLCWIDNPQRLREHPKHHAVDLELTNRINSGYDRARGD